MTLPQAGNLGGGGFMIVHDAESGETVAIDYREKAPGRASRDMFLDAAGNADSKKSQYSGLAVGVPGTVAGLALALERYGTMSLEGRDGAGDPSRGRGRPGDAGFVDSLKANAEELARPGPALRRFSSRRGASLTSRATRCGNRTWRNRSGRSPRVGRMHSTRARSAG